MMDREANRLYRIKKEIASRRCALCPAGGAVFYTEAVPVETPGGQAYAAVGFWLCSSCRDDEDTSKAKVRHKIQQDFIRDKKAAN